MLHVPAEQLQVAVGVLRAPVEAMPARQGLQPVELAAEQSQEAARHLLEFSADAVLQVDTHL